MKISTKIFLIQNRFNLLKNCQMQQVYSKILPKRFTANDVISSVQAQSLVSKYGSPLYVYKQSIIANKIDNLLKSAKEFKVSYALKANTNSHIVKLIKQLGIQHIDVVSPGQIYKAISCGYAPEQIMYTENFISTEEMKYALKVGVVLNIGALQTLRYFRKQLYGKNIFIRINPKIGAGTSHHVITGGPQSKFGIYESDIKQVIDIAKESNIHIIGLHQHIGSNIKKNHEEVFLVTMRYAFDILHLFEEVKEINIGGGLGVAYMDSQEISQPSYLFDEVRKVRDQFSQKYNRQINISIQPGRYIVADSSVLLCTVTGTKNTPLRHFIGTDTGFNHLIRPALYGAHHEIINLTNPNHPNKQPSSICGNICECTDIMGDNVEMGAQIGDILAIQNTGAYGFSMSSNYNERPKPAEVMINKQNEFVLIRRKETFEDLIDKL